MESLLRSALPIANERHIQLGMFADDVSCWKTGSDINKLATDLSTFINHTVDPWATSHNMILSLPKCHSFLFSQWYRDQQPHVYLHGELLSHGSNRDHTYLLLLGVRLDRCLSFQYYITFICKSAGIRLHQLSRVSNSIYGLDQADLITMYISYTRSLLECAAPVWYPCMSATNVQKLQ